VSEGLVELSFDRIVEVDDPCGNAKHYKGQFVRGKPPDDGLYYIDSKEVVWCLISPTLTTSDGQISPYDLVMDAMNRKLRGSVQQQPPSSTSSTTQAERQSIDVDTLIRLRQNFSIEEIIKLRQNGII